ncbi:GNAT family N-acetyltransferase [Micromonospora zhanjiangensis]|uniref:GNAT family N-acetyltransferase n=1 Tax=Micromonospora zhanjiangensis TaxID=1522057 RepID=A0ABV8KK26_9ACTN
MAPLIDDVAIGTSAPDRHLLRHAAGLLAASVPGVCRPLVAYGAERYDAFLARALTPPPAHRSLLLRGVTAGTELIAVADWRILPDALFLNGVAVRDDHRGRGIGTRILADGEAIATRLRLATMLLDVSLGNASAHRLYRRNGFTDTELSAWCWHEPHPGHDQPATAVTLIVDWASLWAQHDAYGFGDCSVRGLDGGIRTVRVVGDRVRAASAADAVVVSRALAIRDRPLRAYRIISDATAGQPFARFIRMRKQLR